MPIIAANTLAWALKNWKLLLGGLVVAGLSIALLLARTDAADWKSAAQASDRALGLEVAKNAINLASIAELQRDLAAKEADTASRAAAFDASHAQSVADVSKAEAAQAADKGRGDALRALAKDLPKQPGCDAPAAVLTNLRGL